MSYRLGNSVNSYIDPDLSSVEYNSFDKVLNTTSVIGPEDFELFGFKFKGLYFHDKCLPMGCSASCALFENNFFIFGMERSASESIEHYADDFLFAGRADSSECTNLMSNFSSLCQELGVPLAVEKTIGPSCVITFLGLEIDTLEIVIKIPPPKLSEVQQKLIETLNKKKITLKDLQSLTGLLNVCALAIPAVRAFNRRFCDASLIISFGFLLV